MAQVGCLPQKSSWHPCQTDPDLLLLSWRWPSKLEPQMVGALVFSCCGTNGYSSPKHLTLSLPKLGVSGLGLYPRCGPCPGMPPAGSCKSEAQCPAGKDQTHPATPTPSQLWGCWSQQTTFFSKATDFKSLRRLAPPRAVTGREICLARLPWGDSLSLPPGEAITDRLSLPPSISVGF